MINAPRRGTARHAPRAAEGFAARFPYSGKTHPVGIIKYELFVLPAPFSAKIELFSAAGNFFGYLKF